MRSDNLQNIVILCRPQTIGLTANDFAANVWADFKPTAISLILIDPDLNEHSQDDLFKMGYSCFLQTPLDKTLLFNALHGVAPLRASDDAVVSFMEHYEKNNKGKRKLNILVAEDNGTNRIIISKILGRAGHAVDLVENGEEALDMLESKSYDLAILDMNMPIVAGLDAVRIHRVVARDKPRLPIIILTANATTEARRECEEAGVDAFLTKPIEAYTLLNVVAELTTERKAAIDSKQLAPTKNTVTAKNEQQLLNKSALHHLMLLGDSDGKFMETVIHGFISEGEQLLMDMQVALRNKEYTSFKDIAHTMKGSAGNVGAQALFHLCREAQQLDHAFLNKSSDAFLEKIQVNFESTRSSLLEFLEASQNHSDTLHSKSIL